MLDIELILRSQGKQPYTGRNITPEERQRGIIPYKPSLELKYAVNLAILLEKRPLLLKGEPGSGKTSLAKAVADELNLPFEPWYIKSTTVARDGLYRFDSVKRLQDAQLAGSTDEKIRDQALARLATSEQFNEQDNAYLQYGALGKAFTSEKTSVILIDEIDKADIDFPNDLLRELDEGVFRIEEIGREKERNCPPLIFITSNDEKDLPDAFLRRCLFFFIEFPQQEELREKVQLHFPDTSQDLIKTAVNRFCELRSQLGTDKGKKISTAELIDWYKVLTIDPNDAKKELSANRKIPYPEVLLKRLEDWNILER
jgi:MoxR-like ATPase